MVAKKKSGSNVASASDAWLFLEHFTKYGSMAAADIDTKGQQELKARLSTVVTFFVLKFAQVSCPLLKTVFLNKRKEEGSVGGVSSIEEDSTISLKIDTVQDDRVFVSTGPVFSHPELKGLSGSFSCQLPAVYLPDQRLWITGLCSVIRQPIFQHLNFIVFSTFWTHKLRLIRLNGRSATVNPYLLSFH